MLTPVLPPGARAGHVTGLHRGLRRVIANADLMRTAFGALNFRRDHDEYPGQLCHLPELLLQHPRSGSCMPQPLTSSATSLAMSLQGACSLGGPIAPWRRALGFAAAFCLMLPTATLMDVLGLALLAPGEAGLQLLPALRRTARAIGERPPQ